ncbi:MAG TPA: arylesterase [Steroidobacteraceae bacterium]
MAWLLAATAALAAAAAVAAAPTAAPGAAPVILVFGDSLSAAHGLSIEQGWVSLLGQQIEREGYGFRVVNASVSGETTAGGLARLPRALDMQRPRIVVLELGANDGLRGLPLNITRENLDRMLSLLQRRHIAVLLLGVRLPPNYGERYTSGFTALYRGLADAHHVALLPFLLENVALDPALMQADGLHPNAKGEPLLLANVWPRLLPLLRAPRRAPGE